jgi:CRISPR system Cascade subunit CasB
MKLERKHVEAAAREWWRSLQPRTSNGHTYQGDRATLARLRRATEPLAAAHEPATLDLYRRLDVARPDASPHQIAAALSRVAVLASVIAHVRNDDEKRLLGRALGPNDAKVPETALLKPLRLARLLAARGDEEIETDFRRAVALLDGTANVGDLAWLVLAWDRDELGDRVRTLFAFAYHDASAHAPNNGSSESPAENTAAAVIAASQS